jgi:hypothetical protein
VSSQPTRQPQKEVDHVARRWHPQKHRDDFADGATRFVAAIIALNQRFPGDRAEFPAARRIGGRTCNALEQSALASFIAEARLRATCDTCAMFTRNGKLCSSGKWRDNLLVLRR